MFWERFQSLCSNFGKKPNAVAKDLNLSSATTTKWKQGAVPGGEILVLLSEYFDCSVDYLLGLSDKSTYTINNSNNAVAGNNNIIQNTADSITEEMMDAFNKLTFQDKIEILNMINNKSKEN